MVCFFSTQGRARRPYICRMRATRSAVLRRYGSGAYPFLRAKFPRLVEQYEKWFAKSGYAPEPYRRKTAERGARIRQMDGLRARPWVEKKHTMPCRQMSLEWDGAVVAKDTERTASLTGE